MTQTKNKGHIITTESWKANIELIYHLLRFSNLMLYVIGDQKSGKTTLKNYIKENAKIDLQVKELNAQVISHPSELPAQIALQFGLKDDSTLTLQERIKSIQEQISTQQKTAILVIDNVDCWSVEILLVLYDFIVISQQGAGLHCLLFGETDSLRKLLASKQLEKYLNHQSHLIQLDPLLDEELDEFVTQYCNQNGIDTNLIKDKNWSEKIKAQSGGYPGYVIELVSRYKLEKNLNQYDYNEENSNILQRTVIEPYQEKIKKLPLHWLVGMGTCAIIIASVSVSLLIEQLSITNIANKSATVTKKFEPELTLEEKTVIVKKEPLTIQKTLPEPKPLDLGVTKPIIEKAQIKSQKITAASTKNNKLMAMNSQHFTLQLLGVSRKESLNQFIKKHKLENATITAQTQRDGKDWYMLLYGDFENHQQAVAGAKELPKPIKQLKPWARKLADVQAIAKP